MPDADRVVGIHGGVFAGLSWQCGERFGKDRWFELNRVEDVLLLRQGHIVLVGRVRVSFSDRRADRQIVGKDPGRELAEQFGPLELVDVGVGDRLNGHNPARPGNRIVFTDANREPRTTRVGAANFGQHPPVLRDDEVGTALSVGRVRRIKAPGARQQISRIGNRRDRNDPFDGRQQADPGLLWKALAVMLEIALEAQAVVHFQVRSHTFKVSVSAQAVNTVFQMRVRRIDADAKLFIGKETATDVECRAVLSEQVAGHSEGRYIVVGCALGDFVDDAGRTGNAEHQCVGPFQRFDALLVLVGGRNHAGDRQPSIETIV